MNRDSSKLSTDAKTWASEEERAQALADLALVQRSLLGNMEATNQFLNRLTSVASIVASRNARMGRPLDSSEVDDVVQSALLIIWQKRSTFTGSGPLEPWIYRISYLEFMNRLRKRFRSHKSIEDVGIESADHLESKDRELPIEFESLYLGLDAVGPPDSDVIRLKHFESMTFDEVGARLDIPSSTAKTQYYRGLLKLRQHLGDSYFEQ